MQNFDNILFVNSFWYLCIKMLMFRCIVCSFICSINNWWDLCYGNFAVLNHNSKKIEIDFVVKITSNHTYYWPKLEFKFHGVQYIQQNFVKFYCITDIVFTFSGRSLNDSWVRPTVKQQYKNQSTSRMVIISRLKTTLLSNEWF